MEFLEKDPGCIRWRLAVGDDEEYGECRLSRRSASDTSTGSGAGTVLRFAASGGGGIVLESKAKNGVTEAWGDLNLTSFDEVVWTDDWPLVEGAGFG